MMSTRRRDIFKQNKQIAIVHSQYLKEKLKKLILGELLNTMSLHCGNILHVNAHLKDFTSTINKSTYAPEYAQSLWVMCTINSTNYKHNHHKQNLP